MPDYPAAFNPVSSKLASNVNGVAQASVAGVANPITAFATYLTGALAMTGIQVPSGFRGLCCILPAGAATGATGGVYASDGKIDTIPFALAFTAVPGRALLLFVDGKLAYPFAA
jgi:hypothetical protein